MFRVLCWCCCVCLLLVRLTSCVVVVLLCFPLLPQIPHDPLWSRLCLTTSLFSGFAGSPTPTHPSSPTIMRETACVRAAYSQTTHNSDMHENCIAITESSWLAWNTLSPSSVVVDLSIVALTVSLNFTLHLHSNNHTCVWCEIDLMIFVLSRVCKAVFLTFKVNSLEASTVLATAKQCCCSAITDLVACV